jgi:sarcosine oxidase subunit alpha
MLAGAVRAFVNRWGVRPGVRVAVFTNNDDGWRTARDLLARGLGLSAVIDTRDRERPLLDASVPVYMNAQVVGTRGRLGLTYVELADGRIVHADCLAVAGGWNPNVHLTCHQRGRPEWREAIAAFVPGGALPPGMAVAGAANGALTLAAALREGRGAGEAALGDLGRKAAKAAVPGAEDEDAAITPFGHVARSRGRAWIDLQNDVTVKDLQISHREGFRAVEHLKRYTTLGMATDQGKTANVLGLAVLA